MTSIIRRLGPGLLFAGAAIGVSHLVQSTRAGADYNMGLLWALLLVNLFKYPFFEYGPRYTGATGESLLDGYGKLGKPFLVTYVILAFFTMFTIQTAVTIVTAGIANTVFPGVFPDEGLFGLSGLELWTIIILSCCVVILIFGRYQLLDRFIKIVIVLLAVSTLFTVLFTGSSEEGSLNFTGFWPKGELDLVFLIAFMGWMPAPIDVSVFHSLWAVNKRKIKSGFDFKSTLLDFNVGYVTTVVVGILFMLLGALVMHNSGLHFDGSAVVFAEQLISLYTTTLGNWSYTFIAIAALTAMFSTTITTLDASPRAMERSLELIFKKPLKLNYLFWLVFLTLGTILIFTTLASEMALLVRVATTISFLTAPFYAALNFKLVCSSQMPVAYRPGRFLRLLSWLGLVFLVVFGLWFIWA